MKIRKSIPTNWAFFNEHGLHYAAYGLIGLLGQLLSGLALLYAVHTLLLNQLGQTATTADWMVIGLAATVALFIELANRKLARPSIKPWVQPQQFTEDASLRRRHEVLTRSYRIILVLVAVVSYLLSGIGSINYAADTAEQPALVSLDSIQAHFKQEAMIVEQGFVRDSSLLNPLLNQRLQAARQRFQNDSTALSHKFYRYVNCATRGNEWCTQQRQTYAGRVAASRRRMTDSLSTIQQEQGQLLQGLLNQRNDRLTSLSVSETQALEQAKAENEERLLLQTQMANLNGYLFLLLTLVGQTIFYCMIYLQLQIEAGSGIEQEVEPNEFWNEASIGNELQVTLNWRIERGLRRLLATVFAEPKADKQTKVPYWGLVKPRLASESGSEEVETVRLTPVKLPVTATADSCSVKETLPFDQELADAKSKLSIYRKRVGKHKQKARVQQQQKGEVEKRTQAAIENNERWAKHWLAEVQRLSAKPKQVMNGTPVKL